MPTPLLIAYNIKGARQGRIRLLASRFGIRYRSIPDSMQGLPLSALIEDALPEAPEKQEGEPFTDEMMVMAYFPRPLASKLLDMFRQQRIQSVRLKAMLTDTNSQWTGKQLHEELQQEAAYFTQMRRKLHEEKLKEESEESSPEA